MGGHYKILSEWRGRGKVVLAEKDVSGDRANMNPYRAQIVETHRFRSEKNLLEYCKREFKMSWEPETK